MKLCPVDTGFVMLHVVLAAPAEVTATADSVLEHGLVPLNEKVKVP